MQVVTGGWNCPPHLKDAHVATIGLEPSPVGDLKVTRADRGEGIPG